MLLNVLPRLDNENAVVSLTDDRDLGRRLEETGIKVFYLGLRRNGLNLPAVVIRFKQIIKRERPDIINSYLIHANLFSRFFGRLYGIKRIICSIRNKHTDKPFLLMCDRMTSRLITRYTMNSPVVRDFMIDKGFDETRMTVIPNGIDFSRFEDITGVGILKSSLGLAEKFCFLTVASLRKKKGHAHLFRAAVRFLREIPEAVFLLAGDGPESESLQSLTRRLGIDRNVIFLKNRNDIPQLLAAADAFVLPSEHEGMSNALLEAMASGTPIVCSDIDENRWVVGKTALLAKINDPEMFSGCLARLFESGEIRKKLAEAGLKRVKKWFSLENTIKEYNNLYQS